MGEIQVIKSTPYWWDKSTFSQVPDQETLPREVDILIVGAGLTGLSAARTAAKAGRSVLVVDQNPPGYGASFRNGGMLGGATDYQFPKCKSDMAKNCPRAIK